MLIRKKGFIKILRKQRWKNGRC